jgi:hypothetical protein
MDNELGSFFFRGNLKTLTFIIKIDIQFSFQTLETSFLKAHTILLEIGDTSNALSLVARETA